MKYKVHLFPVVHLPAVEIEAKNQKQALEKADKLFRGDENRETLIKTSGEYADEVVSYLVDEVGDKEYKNSRWYTEDFQPLWDRDGRAKSDTVFVVNEREIELLQYAVSFLLSNLDAAEDALDVEIPEVEIKDLENRIYTATIQKVKK